MGLTLTPLLIAAVCHKADQCNPALTGDHTMFHVPAHKNAQTPPAQFTPTNR